MIMRYKRPDKKNALSILNAAKKDVKYNLSLKPTEESASTIIRSIYEGFRMLGDALLVAKGVEATDHVEPIKELLKLKVVTKRPINLIDNLRQLRHNINYYGYSPSLLELEDVRSLAETCFEPLLKEALKEINSKE